MKNRFYLTLIILAVLLLALGRLIVRPPVAILSGRRGRQDPRVSAGLSTRFSTHPS
jgi:hypothetical protein